MKQKEIIAVVVIVAIAVAAVLLKHDKGSDMMDQDGQATGSPTGTAKPGTGSTETKAAIGKYKCDGGKTFTLSVRSDGTARALGVGSDSVVLTKSPGTGIWANGTARMSVREAAGYTMLLQEDVVTRDNCHITK